MADIKNLDLAALEEMLMAIAPAGVEQALRLNIQPTQLWVPREPYEMDEAYAARVERARIIVEQMNKKGTFTRG